MTLDLFAGFPVTDLERSLLWYGRLLGSEPAFFPNDAEAVWQVAEHAFVYVEIRPTHAGHARSTLFVDDFEQRLTSAERRGVVPDAQETYANGVRHATYRDPDGNEVCFGGPPTDARSAQTR